MQELEKLINTIQQYYDEITLKWKKQPSYLDLNMKKIQVLDVYKNEEFLSFIFNYRQFLISNNYFSSFLQTINSNNNVRTRVKDKNSILQKIQDYEMKKEKGKVPLKKCLNDIYGVRMIFDEDLDFQKIFTFLEIRYPPRKFKCIESIRGDYRAIHIYFGNTDNKSFQWELQLWDVKHAKTNMISHAKYKQAYTKWEEENK